MKKREKGQSAVEFALVLPILLLIVCGLLDVGWLFYNQLSVDNAGREGARVGCVNAQDAQLDQIVTDKVEAILPHVFAMLYYIRCKTDAKKLC